MAISGIMNSYLRMCCKGDSAGLHNLNLFNNTHKEISLRMFYSD